MTSVLRWEVLADVGLAPRLRLVPVRRQRGSGVA